MTEKKNNRIQVKSNVVAVVAVATAAAVVVIYIATKCRTFYSFDY